MEEGNNTIKEQIRTIQIIHAAIVAGVLLFLMAMTFITKDGIVRDLPEINDPFFWLVTVIAVFSVPVGNMIFRLQLIEANKLEAVSDKIGKYRIGLIIDMAIHEFAAAFSLVAFFIHGNFYYLAIALLLLILMAIKFPSKTKIADSLQLSQTDRDELYH